MKHGRMQKSLIALFVALTLIVSSMYGNVTVEGAKKLSLYIKTTKYVRTNETNKVKKTQTIQIKNLSSKEKVSWNSNNKKLATVKSGKNGKAKLTVSLGKPGKAKITATVRNKKSNKKIKSLSKNITVVNRASIKTTPTVKPTELPKPSQTATVNPSATPTVKPTETLAPPSLDTPVPPTTETPTSPSTETPTSPPTDINETPSPYDPIWVGTWGSSQYSISASDSTAPKLTDSTFRQVVRISTGGKQLRLTFSNEYGQTPLVINSVHIAKPTETGKSNIDASTDTVVKFNGIESVTIPAKGKVISDVIDYPVEALDKIAVSTYFGSTPSTLTHHAGSRSNSFLKAGNAVSDVSMEASTSTFVRWYVLSNVDVLSPAESRAIVCFGDSITDGYGTDATYLGQGPDRYTRWTDTLAEKLKSDQKTKKLSVINMGIGGNSIFGGQGPAGKDRFDRDVLNQTGVGYLVFMIGVNDIGYASDSDTTLADRMIKEYTAMIDKAHAQGIRVFAGTITPFHGNEYYSVRREEIRQEINAWLRQMYKEGEVEGLADFDALLKDPAANPPKLLQKYNVDGLHPNPTGYKAMGELVYDMIAEDIAKFQPSPENPPTPPAPTPDPPKIPSEFVRPSAPEVPEGYEEVNLENISANGGSSEKVIYDADVGVYFFDVDSLNIPLRQTLKAGDKVQVILQGNYVEDDNGKKEGIRSFLSTAGGTWVGDTIAFGYMNPGSSPSVATLTDTEYGFQWEFSQKAINNATQLLFKGHEGGSKLTGKFMLYRLYIKYEIQ